MREAPEATLADVGRHLRRLGVPFALVGGLAVSIRSEVRWRSSQLDALLRDVRGPSRA